MMWLNHMQQRCKRVAYVLAALALAVQALVPTGYMIGKGARDQAIAITLCTVTGNVTAFLSSDGQIVETKPGSDTPHDSGEEGTSLCGFAAQSVAAFSPLQPSVEPQPFDASAATAQSYTSIAAPGRGLAAPPPPKTGPPIQV
jgi:hypothetical protein